MQPKLKNSALAILGLAPPDNVKTYVVGDPPSVRVVPAEFDSIMLNLVSNAVKAINASRNKETGVVCVSLSGESEKLEIRVADNGCGVSPEVLVSCSSPLKANSPMVQGWGFPSLSL